MTKRTKSKLEVEPVEKKTKNNNVNNNINSCFAIAQRIEDCDFVTSYISKSLKDDDKNALKNGKKLNSKGDQIVFALVKKKVFISTNFKFRFYFLQYI